MFRKVFFVVTMTVMTLVSHIAAADSATIDKLSLPILAEDIHSKDIEHSFSGQFEILKLANDITNSSKTLKSTYKSYLEEFAKLNFIKGEKYIEGTPLNEYKYKQIREPSSFNKGKNPLSYMLQSAIEGNSAAVVSTYEMFNDSWADNSTATEIRAQAQILYYLHSTDKYNLLLNICTSPETPAEYTHIACDAYLEKMWDKAKYETILRINKDRNITELSDYGVNIYLLSALILDKQSITINTIESIPSILFRHPQLNDVRLMAEYRDDNFGTVVKLSRTATDNIAHIIADSFINKNRLDIANIYLDKVTNLEYKAYLLAKIDIAKNNLDSASINIQKIQSEELKLGVLQYYIADNFPNVSTAFILQNFKFNTYNKKDYPHYYSGLKQFYDKNYRDCALYLNEIKYPQSIKDDAIFYSGISTLMLSNDVNTVVPELAKIINSPISKKQQELARYMLAQVYHNNSKLDEAIQLLDGCQSIHCEQLASKLNLELGRYEILLSDPSIAETMDNNTDIMTINTPQARLARATAYYNRGYYELATSELDQIHTSSKDALRLYMLIMFKDDREDSATQILINNTDYKPILYSGVKELTDMKNYKLANSLISEESDLPSDMLIIKALVLANLGNLSGAESILNTLINKHELLYDSFKAKIDIQKDIKSKLIAVQTALKQIEEINKSEDTDNFARQDELLAYMASISLEGKENVLLLQTVNLFLANHEGSPQSAYIYSNRAELFYTTDRLAECVKDTDQALKYPPLQPSSAIYDMEQHLKTLFIKADCYSADNELELIQMHSQIYDIYSRLSVKKEIKLNKLREKQITNIRANLITNSSSVDELLKLAYDVEKIDRNLYITAITKYIMLVEDSDLKKSTELVEKLKVSKDKEIQRINSYVQGRLAMNEYFDGEIIDEEVPNTGSPIELSTEQELAKLYRLESAEVIMPNQMAQQVYKPILINFHSVYSAEVEKGVETLSNISLDSLIKSVYIIDIIKQQGDMDNANEDEELKTMIPIAVSAGKKYIKVQ